MTNTGSPFKYLPQSGEGGVAERKISPFTVDIDAVRIPTLEKLMSAFRLYLSISVFSLVS